MLSFETGASAAVGVAISVTTIPASAYLGVAIGGGGIDEALGALVVLIVNVGLLIFAGVAHAIGAADPAEPLGGSGLGGTTAAAASGSGGATTGAGPPSVDHGAGGVLRSS